jgi:ubiquinone/menaquinone biosynthesis C-methylase UbiE
MSPERVLSHAQARRFYERFAGLQDFLHIYEDPATVVLLEHAELSEAQEVVEFGCGSGRMAERLLRDFLPEQARYLGLDISEAMVERTRARLRPWAGRASVRRCEGEPSLPVGEGGCDRVISTYVLDLLAREDIEAFVAEARRALEPTGLLCLACLTEGNTRTSRALCRVWSGLHALEPALVGGCRPIELEPYLEGWSLVHREVVCTMGFCSEVIIARPH